MPTPNLPQQFDYDAPVFPVSVASQLADMHPQTLRGYDKLGLVVPQRARGRGRRYSLRDVAKLRHVQRLSKDEGINLEGVRRIIQLEAHIDGLQVQLQRLNETLQRIQNSPEVARLFTAESTGDVHHGRYRTRERLAITYR